MELLIVSFYAIGLLVGYIVQYYDRQRCLECLQEWRTNPMNRMFPGFWLPSAEKHQQIYDLVRRTNRIFDKANVQPWMVGGTLLGAVRCEPGGIIPWDDDIDLGYNVENTQQIVDLEPELKREGLSLYRAGFGFKIHPTGSHPEVPPFVDLFATSFLSDETTEFALEEARALWPPQKESFHRSDLFPLKRYAFGKTSLWGPKNPTPYLTRKFGPRWNEEGMAVRPHGLPPSCKYLASAKHHVLLRVDQRAPAHDNPK